jgi:hypothetical protein
VPVIFALPRLFDAVVARFAAESVDVPNTFGTREVSRQGPPKRLIWVPGDDGDAGQIGPARYPGRHPRPLATLGELFTVYVVAQDPTASENERAQYQAARELFDAWFRAVYLAAYGTFTVQRVEWVHDKTVRRFGEALRVVCSIEAPIFDEVHDVAPAETGAEIATSLEDVTETTKVAAPVSVATTGPIALAGLQEIDGVLVGDGTRVLVRDQTDPAENGIYVAAAGAWSRAPDADTSGEVPPGLLVVAQLGVAHSGATFVLTTPGPIVLGTTPLTFARMET